LKFYKFISFTDLFHFNAEKSVGGHVKNSITSLFSTESHFTWQLDLEHFRK